MTGRPMLPSMILRKGQLVPPCDSVCVLVRLSPVLRAIPLRLGKNLDARSTMVQPHMDLHPATSQHRYSTVKRADSPFPIVLCLCPDLFGFPALRTCNHLQRRFDGSALFAFGYLRGNQKRPSRKPSHSLQRLLLAPVLHAPDPRASVSPHPLPSAQPSYKPDPNPPSRDTNPSSPNPTPSSPYGHPAPEEVYTLPRAGALWRDDAFPWEGDRLWVGGLGGWFGLCS